MEWSGDQYSTDYQVFDLEVDAVSTAAGIAGLLAIATSLVKGAYTLSISAKEFRKEWTSIANEVAQVLGVLHALKPSFGFGSPSSDQASSYSASSSTPSSPRGSTSSPLSTSSEKEYDVLSVRRTQEYLS